MKKVTSWCSVRIVKLPVFCRMKIYFQRGLLRGKELIHFLFGIFLSFDKCRRSDKKSSWLILPAQETFQGAVIFWTTNWTANNEQSLFQKKINFKWFTIHFKGSKLLPRSSCLVLDKRRRLEVWVFTPLHVKKRLTQVNFSCRSFSACRNLGQSFLAELFAGIRMQFYIWNNLSLAITVSFARGSFTLKCTPLNFGKFFDLIRLPFWVSVNNLWFLNNTSSLTGSDVFNFN